MKGLIVPEWNLDLENGFDRLSIGSSEEELVDVFGEPDDKFRRGGSGPEVYDYPKEGAQVSVLDGRVTFIELGEPAVVSVEGVKPLGMDLDAAVESLEEAGVSVNQSSDSAVWHLESSKARLFEDGDKVATVAFGK